ncbi:MULTISPECIES: DUF1192 domain-containing protein [Brucella]|jgi:uncharacterized small protein (DUF1192 family)|uniref:DUF1192 domain-containing protein n=2 Tax=Brucella TaxID=234 RepID=A0A656Z2U5_BRUAN|nr:MULTISPECIES: DUF1192 domain-containing protein [Brucella]EMG53681.1 hypothetical protein WYI_10789 [Ochrobactrum sp. CDB2]KYB44989.1 hypothetical protein AB664_15695 [Brucella anthropi]MBK0023397.1 DUF1192 domain-containing protein [Ochrobactrum sp. S45]MBK0045233.1 DUF1192 domain-containing protein [Ochrobactrum sp. S46]MBO1026205.1 DUF1192 domain-containing protein [Ochrobactrum sp. SD129]MQP42299.1 DUF1192 family protein [Ochrobactrum sp. MYb237]QWK77280.1 DUF1192 domain-containing pr
MSGFDEEVKKPRESVVLSEDELSLLSVIEIDQRIALLQSEIERLKAERLRKGDSRAAAEALFR